MKECAIIIPTCDRPYTVKRAAASALTALDRANVSGVVIISDDSTDPTLNNSIAIYNDTYLHRFINTELKGPAGARNFGAKQTQAELLFFLDDDDVMAPDYIRQVLLQRRSGAHDAVWGFCNWLEGRTRKRMPYQSAMLDNGISLSNRLVPLSAGFWIERTTFDAFGGLDTELQINEDTDFCLTLAAAGLAPWYEATAGIVKNGARTENSRCLASITKTATPADRAAAWQYILEKHAAFLKNHDGERKVFLEKLAKYCARSGNYSGAISIAIAQQGTARWTNLAHAIVGATTRHR